ncbi:hypothetical protein [Actinopolymorpha pittospori]
MARISLDFDRILGRVDPRIFGAFVEHEGRCIYGGIVEEGSPVADSAGFRTDVRRAIEDLQVPVLRWPGGNFVSAYHWQDGIGPKDARPQRFDPAWGAVESNRFGTDEFVTYCELLGAEPYVCLNMGTGTLEEAMAWVEYCNGDLDTDWANRRRHNGRQEPYAVRYWGLGNELWGEFQVGHLSVERYVEKAKQWALRFAVSIRPSNWWPAATTAGATGTGWSSTNSFRTSTSTAFTSTPAPTTTGATSSSRTRSTVPCARAGR